jgi:hypothetical protein
MRARYPLRLKHFDRRYDPHRVGVRSCLGEGRGKPSASRPQVRATLQQPRVDVPYGETTLQPIRPCLRHRAPQRKAYVDCSSAES